MSSRQRQNKSGAQRNLGTSSYDEAMPTAGRSGSGRSRYRGGRGSGGSKGPGKYVLPLPLMILFVLVALRLVWLQVVSAGTLSAKGDTQHTTSIELLAKRGTIYDRNGNVLATSVECQTLYCNPNAVSDKSAAAQLMVASLGGELATYQDILNQDTTFAYIQKRVDDDIADAFMESIVEQNIDGIYTMDDVKRIYPYDSTAGQVLGFVGTDGDGLSGLELYYNDILKGTNGEMIMEVGRTGTPVAGGAYEIHEAQDGTDIVISIDVNVQRIAEEQLVQGVADASAQSGNVVVANPKTGEILAACSTPLYNPSDPSTLTNEALNLACVTASYEPGSTFKPLTLAIGYENAIFNRSTSYNVPAEVTVGDDEVTDVDGRDYAMDMTPTDILVRSSNTGAALLGMQIGADLFSEGIAKFGIGTATGIDFPGESSGLVLSRDEYTGASVGSMSFGQSLSFPSVQLVRAISAIANDGTIVTPHFLIQKGGENVDWGEGEQIISTETANMVTEDMVAVVNEDGGTGANARVDGYKIAGKTGTGEMASSEGGYLADSFLGSFIGFANADDPSVIAYVGLYGTAQHGGTAAAPVFAAIMSEALVDLGVQPLG